MQATARRLSVVSATFCARRRLIRDVRPTNESHVQPSDRYRLVFAGRFRSRRRPEEVRRISWDS